MSLPNNFKDLIYILDKNINFKNILIVNTDKTGLFLNDCFPEKKISRISYTPNNYPQFIKIMIKLNKKFDLICVDPYHEYKESLGTLKLLTFLLDKDGILISHDCNPPSFTSTSCTYKAGEWCGVTYAAFVEVAYYNPEWYYTVINKDYGLGIISKKEIQFVKKIIDKEKQKKFLDLFKQNKYKPAYDYYKAHAFDIINLIN
jgi:hypothetical protein